MSEKVEGTIVLDGLLEGQLADEAHLASRLRDWARLAGRRRGLRFELQDEGSRFNVMPDNSAVPADRLGEDPAETIADLLDDLLRELPPPLKGGVFSTLRSTEYRTGEEVQTLYVAEGGTVDARQRTVEADTVAPPAPPTRKDWLRLAGMGLLAAVLVFLISAVFVDYRTLWNRLREGVTPFEPADVAVESGQFSKHLSVSVKEIRSMPRALVLQVRRTAAFPRTDAAIAALAKADANSLPGRLAVEAIARGYVRCESFDKKGQFMGFAMLRIASLREKEAVEAVLPIPRDRRPAKLVLRP